MPPKGRRFLVAATGAKEIASGMTVAVWPPMLVHRCAVVLSLVVAACSSTAVRASAVDPEQDEAEQAEADPAAAHTVFDSSVPANAGLGILQLLPSRAYSGFDGVHGFEVPLGVYGGGEDVTLTADDPDAAVVTPTKLLTTTRPDTGVYFMVAVRRAGTIALTARSNGRAARGTISVASYGSGRWAVGAARYTATGANGEPACTSCHVDGRAIDHSPAVLAGATDLDVGRIVTAGELPSRQRIVSGCETCTEKGKSHRWTLDNEERDGLVAYLRGLESRGFE